MSDLRFTLQWHVTDRCNLRCAHCYQGERGADPPYNQLLSALGQFTDLLGRLSDQRGVGVRGHVNLTGGEPLVREDLMDLIREIRRAGLTFALLTNGTLLDDRFVMELRDLRPSYVQVSVDGLEDTHDRIRGKGSYRRAADGLCRLDRAGIRTMVSFTAHRANCGDLEATARMMRKLGAEKVWTDRMVPLGSGAGIASEVLTPQETREYVRALGRARRGRTGIAHPEVAMDRALQFLGGNGSPYRCTAGYSLLALLPDGQVYPCRRMPIPVGNINDKELSDIYFGSEVLIRLRDPERMDDRCRACAFSRVCHGGLRCMSYALTGDPFIADPGCWLANP
jgi:radical SAM protein with 4Fe4S-binding SPASM domain